MLASAAKEQGDEAGQAQDLGLFTTSYVEARKAFLDAVAQVPNSAVESHRVGEEADLRGPDGEELMIDIVTLWSSEDEAAPEAPTAVFLHTSGIHGVEGFAGSAIQTNAMLAWAAAGGAPVSAGQLAVFVHAVNPFGMAWWSRFNEHNVDLNRNALTLPGRAEGDAAAFAHFLENRNEDYVTFSDVMNPTAIGCCDCFPLRAACLIACHGMDRLKRGSASGQYFKPDGIFYGGGSLQQGHEIVLGALLRLGVSRDNSALSRFAHIDVHTGLGRSGVDSLLAPAGQSLTLLREVAGVVGEEARLTQGATAADMVVQPSGGTEGVFYPTHGGFLSGVASLMGPQAPGQDGIIPAPHDCGSLIEYKRTLAAQAAADAAATQQEGEAAASNDTRPAEGTGEEGKAEEGTVAPPTVPAGGVAEGTPLVKLHIVQEFGTLPPAEVVRALRALNCATAGTTKPLAHMAPERRQVLAAFYRDEPEWKSALLRRGQLVLEQFMTAALGIPVVGAGEAKEGATEGPAVAAE